MNSRGLIVGTLSIGVGLGGVLGYTVATQRTITPVASTIVTNMVVKKMSAPVVTVTNEIVEAPDFRWSSVESQDYFEYVSKLRKVGCPEETIRDIIIADVNKLYASKARALTSPGEFKFWKMDPRYNNSLSLSTQKQLQTLDREKKNLIHDLLGVDLDREMAKQSDGTSYTEQAYAFLSPEKQQQLIALRDQARTQERDIYAAADGDLSPEQRQQVDAIRKQRDLAIASLLTPAELEEYQMRSSGTARNMRYSLASFEPSEDEFRQLFKLRKAFDDQFSNIEGNDKLAQEQRRLAQEATDSQIKSLLGEERYQEYKLAQSGDYQEIYRVTQRYDLPKEVAKNVYDMRRTVEAERRKVEQNQNFTPEQKKEILQAMQQKTEQAVQSAMGEKGYNYYKKRDGDWIQRVGRVGGRRG
jgi:hypothetical protein